MRSRAIDSDRKCVYRRSVCDGGGVRNLKETQVIMHRKESRKAKFSKWESKGAHPNHDNSSTRKLPDLTNSLLERVISLHKRWRQGGLFSIII